MGVLLRRGDTFELASSCRIDSSNTLIGAYGEGTLPILQYIGEAGYSAIIKINSESAHNTVIQDIHFDSIHDPSILRDTVDGIKPGSSNTTVRGCRFSNISLALNCNLQPKGVMAIGNSAETIAAYFSWVQGEDHVYLDNDVEGSWFEHNIRLGGARRVLIAHNRLTNEPKTTIWAMLGEYLTISRNELSDGRVRIGPNPYVGSPEDRFRHAVVERNVILQSGGVNASIEMMAGSEHVMIRNNIVRADDRACVSIQGYDPEKDRTCSEIMIVNNTGMNDSDGGQFVIIRDGAEKLKLTNNIYVAPNLITGDSHTANVYVESDDLAAFTSVSGNVWAKPAGFAWVSRASHYVWPYWAEAEGYRTILEWDEFAAVSDDNTARLILDSRYAPVAQGASIVLRASLADGVYVDFHGKVRPADLAWTPGAVQVNEMLAMPASADINGDGVTDVEDIVLLPAAWGSGDAASTAGVADVNRDGFVDAMDLMSVVIELAYPPTTGR